MGIRIIIDSTADYTVEQAKAMGVEIAPLKVSFGTEDYVDKFTITNEQFYDKLKNSGVIPTTTLVSPQYFSEMFQKSDDDIVGIFISGKLSGTYQSAVVAKTELGRDNIYLIDSGSATIGAALLVEQAVKFREQGFSGKEINEKLSLMVPRLRIYIAFDTLKYLVKGGRLPAAQGVLGGMMGIRPVALVQDGVINMQGKERGMKKAVDFLLSQMEKNCKVDESLPMYFAHSDNLEDLNYLGRNFDMKGRVLTFGSIIGTHTGPGAIGVAFFDK